MKGPVSCTDCGHEFEIDPVFTVPCPACRAPAGRNCKRPSGHPIMSATRFHDARDIAADDAGAYEHQCTPAATARIRRARERRGKK